MTEKAFHKIQSLVGIFQGNLPTGRFKIPGQAIEAECEIVEIRCKVKGRSFDRQGTAPAFFGSRPGLCYHEAEDLICSVERAGYP